ncbi:hypothetical protein ACKLNR_006633 [Fusarium oxysporum f. sp. zingiberi]|nr:hypothetical protein H9L39_11705 [Fusarium oxysporum f. sp. albedinis]
MQKQSFYLNLGTNFRAGTLMNLIATIYSALWLHKIKQPRKRSPFDFARSLMAFMATTVVCHFQYGGNLDAQYAL